MTTQFRKTSIGDRVVSTFQDNVDAALRPITACPILGGHIVGPITFVSGVATKVDHLLGRKLQGFICVDKDGIADFFRTPSLSPELQFTLTANASVTASFWTF